MAARRLVLNGLTAEVAGETNAEHVEHAEHVQLTEHEHARCENPTSAPASPEFYHELELYRQLLALPAERPPRRRSRTPDPPPPSAVRVVTVLVSLLDVVSRRCRTPAPRTTPRAAPRTPRAPLLPVSRPAKIRARQYANRYN
ncbi:uncharacterized protein LOC124532437 [Vanessa cardui]|uniref:uncharacterized protein LOC124532437 n=1 Tax=Vanessa cardui TaxID=171605 RepID=UPI001F13CB61|nr:uncharacterized protein LOC124532437 [Vanessa cardui]